jgi:zinc transporter ZupT
VPDGRRWFRALLPAVPLAGLLALLAWWGPADALRGGAPPVEALTFQRVVLHPGGIRATVLNDGPDEVTIAQVQVDEAFWAFAADRGQVLAHLGRTTLEIPYPWVAGDAHVVKVLTSTGATFEYEVGVAMETPAPSARYFGVFTLIGLYVGVLPVAIGLLWFPFLAGLSARGLSFLLALTVGLLLFLLVDGTGDGLEAAGALAGSYQGVVLFVLAAVLAYLSLDGLSAALRRRRAQAGAGTSSWVLALSIAVGIGLHNFGEGLAIGAAFALGEAALGTLLIIGFTLHNTTEGLAIVAPLARDGGPAPLGALVQLGLIGGVPTIAGAWVGGFVYSPVWAVLFLAVGVGAIAQVIGQIARQMAGDRSPARWLAEGPSLARLTAGFAVMYATGMLVG